MQVLFTTKSLNEVIGYWIETQYMYSKLTDLSEYSDEVGEKFENKFSNSGDWCKGCTNLLHEQLISFVALGGIMNFHPGYRMTRMAMVFPLWISMY